MRDCIVLNATLKVITVANSYLRFASETMQYVCKSLPSMLYSEAIGAPPGSFRLLPRGDEKML